MLGLLVWLTRHPMIAVVAALCALGVVAVAVLALFNGAPTTDAAPPTTPGVEVAPSTLPSPTQHPPPGRVETAHQALHALGRACKSPLARRKPESVSEPLKVIKSFATDFPGGGFTVDDESASTLTLLLVVWNELKTCEPSRVPQIERLIPAEYRGG